MSEEMLYSEQYERVVYDYLLKNTRNGSLRWNVSIEKAYREDVPAAEVFTLRDLANVERVGSCSDDLATAIHTLIRDDSGTYTYKMNVRVSSSASRVEYTNHGFSRERLHDLYTIITATVHISNNAVLVEYYNRVLKNSGKDN